jgi:hypothetical protein
MKATTMEKPAIRETRKSNGAQRARIETRRDARASLTAAGDRQIAEIERTFTIRYEW